MNVHKTKLKKQEPPVFPKCTSHDGEFALLLNAVGEEAIKLYNTFALSADRNNYQGVLETFEKHVNV